MTSVTLLVPDSLQPVLTAQNVDGGSGLDIVQYSPLAGLPVRACPESYDSTCANGTPWQTTNDAGLSTFTLLNSFDGFFEFDPDAGLFTTSFWPGLMVAGDTTATIGATTLPLAAIGELQAVLPGVHIDGEADGGLGHVLLTVYDCQDHSAPGVSFTPSSTAPAGGGYATQLFYTASAGGPGMELPSTTATKTDNSGTGGILNVPTGLLTVAVTQASTGRQVGVVNVLVPPGRAAAAILRVRTH
jgi:hypothetical protein